MSVVLTSTEALDRYEGRWARDPNNSTEQEADMAEVIERTSVEDFLAVIPGFRVSVGSYRSTFHVSGYVTDDILRSKHVYADGATPKEALAGYREKYDAALLEGRKIKTAAECKEAVLDLIREHDAAPASFRDAVDALQVSDR